MVPSWVKEHESDKRALEKAGLDSIISALIKLHVYVTLKSEGLLAMVNECRIKNIEASEKMYENAGSFIQLFSLLLKYSFGFPKNIIDYIRRPIHCTHPPLRLRIALLLHHAYQSSNMTR